MRHKVYLNGVPTGTVDTETMTALRRAVRSDPSVYMRQFSLLTAVAGRVFALLACLALPLSIWLGLSYVIVYPHAVADTLSGLLHDQTVLLEGSSTFLIAYLVVDLLIGAVAIFLMPDAFGLANAFADALHQRLRHHLGITGEGRLTLALERGEAELSTTPGRPKSTGLARGV
ncbi:hypothetical protein [Cupriavidus malaysiensis]|nr:hypothetical protein [Cupriavidus malaysiensis]